MNRFTTPILKLVLAVAALAAVAAGTATAASLVTGKQVRNASLTGKDIKKRSLGAKHLNKKAKAALRGAAGAPGAPGAKGDKGDQGIQGERGPSTAFAQRLEDSKTILNADAGTVLEGELPVGSYTVMAKFMIANAQGFDTQPNCEVGVIRGAELELFEAIDQVDDVTLGAKDTATDTLEIVLTGVVTTDSETQGYKVRCDPGTAAVNVRDRTFIATQVAELK